jgi:flagellum-specific ATP synthase
MSLNPLPLPVIERRALGVRVSTGLAALDTFLPLCRGQRIGLFSGSGVGKSTLLADLAKGVDADVVVLALIGERSREVREFVEETLGADGRKRAIVFVSTCDEPAPAKRRTALLAMTAAEYFRDQGLHVLFLFDSITRFADAHREIGLTAGETPSLRAYPPSTARTVAALAERAGPGAGKGGDITAVFTVLVSGSDMDEPVADMVRSILDGHIILDRGIAERGRFPSIDIRRSVSRSLPKAATADENELLSEARALIAAYEEALTMIQTGLYAKGSDARIDRAIALWPMLDEFVTQRSPNCAQSFVRLQKILRS